MKNVLVLFAHPRFERSRTNRLLIHQIQDLAHVTVHDLYELYPDFNINLNKEKELLLAHDVIVWHHPLYWYSCPPLLKQWIDIVLEFGWAYGPNGTALEGKQVFNAITSGGSREMYQSGGRNRFTIQEFLRPFEQTAVLCGMEYHAPFAINGTHKLDKGDLEKQAIHYRKLIQSCVHDELIYTDDKGDATGYFQNDRAL